MEQRIVEKNIRVCMSEAQKAIDTGNTPFGCVLLDHEGNIAARAYNKVNSTDDPSSHAEINAIKILCKQINSFNLDSYVLFANAESCPMCMACALRAGIKNFYFGAVSGPTTNPDLSVREMAERAKHKTKIQSGSLKKECEEQIALGYAKLSN